MVVTSSAQSTHLLLQQVDFLLHYFGRTWGMARILSFFELRQKLQTRRISFHHWFMGNLSMFTSLWSFELPGFNLNIWGFYWLSFRLSLWCRLGFHLCLCCGNSFGLWSLAVGKDWEKQDFRHVFDMLLIINVLGLMTIWITQVSSVFLFPVNTKVLLVLLLVPHVPWWWEQQQSAKGSKQQTSRAQQSFFFSAHDQSRNARNVTTPDINLDESCTSFWLWTVCTPCDIKPAWGGSQCQGQEFPCHATSDWQSQPFPRAYKKASNWYELLGNFSTSCHSILPCLSSLLRLRERYMVSSKVKMAPASLEIIETHEA